MQRIISALIIVALGGFAFTQFVSYRSKAPDVGADSPRALTSTPPAAAFRCDGRTHCSQMKSCEEAKYFLRNCPGTKMDGDGDGIPCERQWCDGG